jgi:hypothetical protein
MNRSGLLILNETNVATRLKACKELQHALK